MIQKFFIILGIVALFAAHTVLAGVSFVQKNSVTGFDLGCSACIKQNFTATTGAGNFILIQVEYDISINVTAVTDTAGNTFALVGAPASLNSDINIPWTQAIYYAKNIISTSTDDVVVTFNASSGPMVPDLNILEYSGVDNSNPFDGYAHIIGAAAYPTVFVSSTLSGGDLIVGLFNVDAGVIRPTAGFSTRAGTIGSSFPWVGDKEISINGYYGAEVGTGGTYGNFTGGVVPLRAPLTGTSNTGTLDSTTFDTGVASGTQLNSVLWQGALNNGAVKFQFAVSNSSSGPWNFIGPDNTTSTFFTGNPGASINLVSTNNLYGYNLFAGYRYFRYRATLVLGDSSPRVDDVVVNWSP
jgi:hypothetical protein